MSINFSDENTISRSPSKYVFLTSLCKYAMEMTAWLCGVLILENWTKGTAFKELYVSLVFMLIVFTGICFIKEKMTGLPVMLISNGLIFALLVFFHTIYIKFLRVIFYLSTVSMLACYLMVIISVWLCIEIWRRNYAKKSYDGRLVFLVFPAALYLYGAYKDLGGLCLTAVVFAAFIMLLHFWCLYFKGLIYVLGSTKDLDNVPGTSIYVKGRKSLNVISGIFVMLVIMALLFDNNYVALFIGKYILKGILWVIYGILMALGQVASYLTVMGVDPDGVRELADNFTANTAGNSTFLDLLVKIVGIICIILFFRFIFKELAAYFRKGEKFETKLRIKTGENDCDTIEAVIFDETEKEKPGRTSSEKVRRMFKKYVESGYKTSIPEEKTSGELIDGLLDAKDREDLPEGADKMKEIYDSARYSDNKLGKKDEGDMNRAIKDVKSWKKRSG